LVTTTYNRAGVVGRAIESVLAQEFEDWELVVVDDASTDSTREVVDSYTDRRLSYFRLDSNHGVLAAKNYGLDRALGSWIGLLDSDDALLPGALGEVMSLTDGLPHEPGTVIGNCVYSSDGSPSGRGAFGSGFLRFEDFLCGRISGEFWGVFSSRALAGRRFDPRLRGIERMLWLKLWKESATYYLDRPLLIKHRSEDSLTRPSNMIGDAAAVARSYGSFLGTFGRDIEKVCPRQIAYYLRRKGYFEIVSGRRRTGLSDVIRSFSHHLSGEGVGLLGAGMVLPKSLIARIGEGRRAVTS
ncbi:MAG: glycosyltransferase family 2 protein, partial [Actinomycetota bacterium]